MDGHAHGHRLGFEQATVGILAAVELVEHDDGPGAAVPGGGEVALDAARVEVAVQPGDEEDGVDVGRHHLLVGALAGHLARELGSAGEDGVDQGAAVACRRT
jgi:hypothetical protein